MGRWKSLICVWVGSVARGRRTSICVLQGGCCCHVYHHYHHHPHHHHPTAIIITINTAYCHTKNLSFFSLSRSHSYFFKREKGWVRETDSSIHCNKNLLPSSTSGRHTTTDCNLHNSCSLSQNENKIALLLFSQRFSQEWPDSKWL